MNGLTKPQTYMNNQSNIKKLLEKGVIKNELEFERALVFDRKLRLMSKEDPELVPFREKLRTLIKAYESKNWASL